jgi:hypothetical protein
MIAPRISAEWHEAPPEVTGGRRPDALNMMIVRRRRQLVYSVKLSNFLRDPIVSAGAASISAFAMAYIPSAIANPPPTFPGFLIALAFTLLRSVAHPVGYGEAALLHKLNQIAEENGIVPASDIAELGTVLVERYGYVKGNNSNEVHSLIASLKAWDAVKEVEGGLSVTESVPFGLGALEYIERACKPFQRPRHFDFTS